MHFSDQEIGHYIESSDADLSFGEDVIRQAIISGMNYGQFIRYCVEHTVANMAKPK